MGGLMQMSSMCESNLATGDSLEDGMRKGHDSNGITIHILVEDVGQTLEKAAKAGGKVTREMWVEGGHTELGEFMDSEGNAVGILRWLI
jgi:predicted enzyme related to lactoylglutathione lyase